MGNMHLYSPRTEMRDWFSTLENNDLVLVRITADMGGPKYDSLTNGSFIDDQYFVLEVNKKEGQSWIELSQFNWPTAPKPGLFGSLNIKKYITGTDHIDHMSSFDVGSFVQAVIEKMADGYYVEYGRIHETSGRQAEARFDAARARQQQVVDHTSPVN